MAPRNYTATVKRVITGDSIGVTMTGGNHDAGSFVIRLRTADAPEPFGPRKVRGGSSRAAAWTWLGTATTVNGESIGLDQWGRTVCTVEGGDGGGELGAHLISENQADAPQSETGTDPILITWKPRLDGGRGTGNLVVDPWPSLCDCSDGNKSNCPTTIDVSSPGNAYFNARANTLTRSGNSWLNGGFDALTCDASSGYYILNWTLPCKTGTGVYQATYRARGTGPDCCPALGNPWEKLDLTFEGGSPACAGDPPPLSAAPSIETS